MTYRTEALFILGSFRTIFLLRYNTHCFCSSAVCARTKSSFAEIRSMFTKYKSCHNSFVKLNWLGYERPKLSEFAFNNNMQGSYKFLNPKVETFSRLFSKTISFPRLEVIKRVTHTDLKKAATKPFFRCTAKVRVRLNKI